MVSRGYPRSSMRANSLGWSVEPNVLLNSNIEEVNIYAYEFSVFECNNNSMDLPSCVLD